jgi:hypothetical protein
MGLGFWTSPLVLGHCYMLALVCLWSYTLVFVAVVVVVFVVMASDPRFAVGIGFDSG